MQILSLITFRKGKTTHPPPSFYKNWLLCSDAISKINHPTHKIVRVPQDEFIIGLLWSALITYWPWWVLFTLIPLSFSAMTTMFCFLGFCILFSSVDMCLYTVCPVIIKKTQQTLSSPAEPIVRNGRPPSAHSVHSFLHQYTGSFKKPPLRRPQSVIGGGLGSLMVMPRNGSRLGESRLTCLLSNLIFDFYISGLKWRNSQRFLLWPYVEGVELLLGLNSLSYPFLLRELYHACAQKNHCFMQRCTSIYPLLWPHFCPFCKEI